MNARMSPIIVLVIPPYHTSHRKHIRVLPELVDLSLFLNDMGLPLLWQGSCCKKESNGIPDAIADVSKTAR